MPLIIYGEADNMYNKRPWGSFYRLINTRTYWVKVLIVNPGQSLSLQSHEKRSETWICVKGEGKALIIDYPKTLKNGNIHFLSPGSLVSIPTKTKHRLINDSDDLLRVVEIALGTPDEEDIIRYEDDYGRICEEQDPEGSQG